MCRRGVAIKGPPIQRREMEREWESYYLARRGLVLLCTAGLDVPAIEGPPIQRREFGVDGRYRPVQVLGTYKKKTVKNFYTIKKSEAKYMVNVKINVIFLFIFISYIIYTYLHIT